MAYRRNLFLDQSQDFIKEDTAISNGISRSSKLINSMKLQSEKQNSTESKPERSFSKFKTFQNRKNSGISFQKSNGANPNKESENNINPFSFMLLASLPTSRKKSPESRQRRLSMRTQKLEFRRQNTGDSPLITALGAVALLNQKFSRESKIQNRRSSLSALKFKMKRSDKKGQGYYQRKYRSAEVSYTSQQNLEIVKKQQAQIQEVQKIQEDIYMKKTKESLNKENRARAHSLQNLMQGGLEIKANLQQIIKSEEEFEAESETNNIVCEHCGSVKQNILMKQIKKPSNIVAYCKQLTKICTNLTSLRQKLQEEIKQYQTYFSSTFKEVSEKLQEYGKNLSMKELEKHRQEQHSFNEIKFKVTNSIFLTQQKVICQHQENQNRSKMSERSERSAGKIVKNKRREEILQFRNHIVQNFRMEQLRRIQRKHNNKNFEEKLIVDEQLYNRSCAKSLFSSKDPRSPPTRQKYLLDEPPKTERICRNNGLERQLRRNEHSKCSHKSLDNFTNSYENIQTVLNNIKLSFL